MYGQIVKKKSIFGARSSKFPRVCDIKFIEVSDIWMKSFRLIYYFQCLQYVNIWAYGKIAGTLPTLCTKSLQFH